jgi:hypothetical protein
MHRSQLELVLFQDRQHVFHQAPKTVAHQLVRQAGPASLDVGHVEWHLFVELLELSRHGSGAADDEIDWVRA